MSNESNDWVPESPSQPPAPIEKTDGLYQKFYVSRTDGSSAEGGKHHGCRYFVLDLDHDPFAPLAMLVYGMCVDAASPTSEKPQLAKDIYAMWPEEKFPLGVIDWVNEAMAPIRRKLLAEKGHQDFMQRFNLKSKQ